MSAYRRIKYELKEKSASAWYWSEYFTAKEVDPKVFIVSVDIAVRGFLKFSFVFERDERRWLSFTRLYVLAFTRVNYHPSFLQLSVTCRIDQVNRSIGRRMYSWEEGNWSLPNFGLLCLGNLLSSFHAVSFQANETLRCKDPRNFTTISSHCGPWGSYDKRSPINNNNARRMPKWSSSANF